MQLCSPERDAVMEEPSERLKNGAELSINSRGHQNKNWGLELAKEGELGKPVGFQLGTPKGDILGIKVNKK